MLVLDMSGHVVAANRGFPRVVDSATGDVRGLHLSDLLSQCDGPKGDWTHVLAGGAAEINRSDGTKLPVTIETKMAADLSGKSYGFVVRLTRPGGLAQASGDAGDIAPLPMLQNTHRLRNVLTVIEGTVGLLEHQPDSKLFDRRLGLIRGAVDSAVDIIEQMESGSAATC